MVQDMPPRYLDPKVKWVWMFPTLLAITVLWVLLVLFSQVLVPDPYVFGVSKPLFYMLFLIGIIAFVAAPVYAWGHIEYMSFTFELADHEFIIRQGVITRHTTVIPYNRIQNINTTRTLTERLMGLATLQIETAGANASVSEGYLQGISHKDALISEIMAKVEYMKRSQDKSGATAVKTELEMLAEILKELQMLNHNISGRPAVRPHDSASRPRASWKHMEPENSNLKR